MNRPTQLFALATALLMASILVACSSAAASSPAPSGAAPSAPSTGAASPSAPAPSGAGGAITTPDQAVAAVQALDPRFALVEPYNPEMIGQCCFSKVATTADGWTVTIEIGWGDCPSGCISRHQWMFAVAPDGVVTPTGETGLPVPSGIPAGA